MNSTSTQASQSSIDSKKSFWFNYIWPIYKHETPQFLFTTLLMFCILFIQNLIRALKDSIVITNIGAESISFLKFWGVMPAAILMSILYVQLITKFRAQTVFYILLSSFLVFFAFFAFVLFPNHEYYHLNPEVTKNFVFAYPHFKWFILFISKWGFSLFYIIAELWPNAVFALLFWQFVNSVTTVDQSTRFYLLFGLLGQTGLYFAGEFLKNSQNMGMYLIHSFDLAVHINVLSVQLVLGVVLILGVVAIGAFWYLNNKILSHIKVEFKAKKQKMSLKDSFKLVAGSRYIMLIAVLLLTYGIAINLAEGPWKARAAQLYPTAQEYLAFVGGYLSYTGLFTILFVILGSNIVRFLGWYAAAIITPIMVFVTGIGFFGISNFDLLSMIGIVGTDPLTLAVTIGAIQNVLSKSSKYTVFDSTKEMAYVPLTDELKTKGKAAVDVVGIKLGKSLSAFLQAGIFMIVPTATYHSISIYIMVIFTIVCFIWIWAVRELGKEYSKLTKNK